MKTENSIDALVALMNKGLVEKNAQQVANYKASLNNAPYTKNSVLGVTWKLYTSMLHRNIEQDLFYLEQCKYHAIDGKVFYGIVGSNTHLDFLERV